MTFPGEKLIHHRFQDVLFILILLFKAHIYTHTSYLSYIQGPSILQDQCLEDEHVHGRTKIACTIAQLLIYNTYSGTHKTRTIFRRIITDFSSSKFSNLQLYMFTRFWALGKSLFVASSSDHWPFLLEPIFFSADYVTCAIFSKLWGKCLKTLNIYGHYVFAKYCARA